MTGISAAVTIAICSLFVPQTAYAATDAVPGPAEQAVLAAYRQMQEADRKGDGVLWLALRDRATLGAMNEGIKETIRKGGHSRPSVRYEPLAARAAGMRSVILGKVTDPEAGTVQYEAVLFVLEDAEWKVAREQWNEKPFDPFVLYALLEPPDGAFARDGSPWKLVPYASSNWDVVRKEDVVWKMQATFDEAFLYVRYESTQPLPAAGARVRTNVGKTGGTGGPPDPPAMQIKNSGASLYAISVGSLVSTTSAVDAKGKPAGDKYSVVYTLSVKKSEKDEVFAATVGENSHSLLLNVHERFIDIRIPLGGLGGPQDAKPSIDLEETDPVNRVLPYHAQPYPK